MGGVTAGIPIVGDITGDKAAKKMKKESKRQQAEANAQKAVEKEKRKDLIVQQRSQLGVNTGQFNTSTTGATGLDNNKLG